MSVCIARNLSIVHIVVTSSIAMRHSTADDSLDLTTASRHACARPLRARATNCIADRESLPGHLMTAMTCTMCAVPVVCQKCTFAACVGQMCMGGKGGGERGRGRRDYIQGAVDNGVVELSQNTGHN